MKLYYFNPNSYGTEAIVCAETKEEAIAALLKTKVSVVRDDDYLGQIHNEDIDDMVNLKGYTLEEIEPRIPLFTERS